MERPGKRCNVAGISVVKNEQDIIEPFVRHNLKFLGSLWVMNNGSTDNTWEILKQLSQEFSSLVILQDAEFAHSQSPRMTRMLRSVHSTCNPDFVMPLDADEFIGADEAEFFALLRNIPCGGYGLVPWRTFVATPDVVRFADDPPRALPWRRRKELPVFYKIILRTSDLDVDDLVIEHGNHHVSAISGRELSRVVLDQLPLLHFPVRSRDQFIAKIVIGWMTTLARDPAARASGATWHKRYSFDMMASGQAVDDKALCELSMLYAQDPRPIDWQTDLVRDNPHFDYVRRYSSGKPCDAFQLILHCCEQSFQVQQRSGHAFTADASARPTSNGDYKNLGSYAKSYSALNEGVAPRREQALAEKKAVSRELEEVRELLLAAEESLRRERTLRIAIQHSLSWRVTGPVRKLLTALRSGRPRTNGSCGVKAENLE
jgi:Glycosyl transferase family 2